MWNPPHLGFFTSTWITYRVLLSFPSHCYGHDQVLLRFFMFFSFYQDLVFNYCIFHLSYLFTNSKCCFVHPFIDLEFMSVCAHTCVFLNYEINKIVDLHVLHVCVLLLIIMLIFGDHSLFIFPYILPWFSSNLYIKSPHSLLSFFLFYWWFSFVSF